MVFKTCSYVQCLFSFLIRAVGLYITNQRKPMLDQLREGLGIYNLNKVIQMKPLECRGLFVVREDDEVRSSVLKRYI